MNRFKNVSLKRRVVAIFAALAIPGVLVLIVYTATAMNTMKTKLANAGESSLRLLESRMERQTNAVEAYLVDLALHSEEFRRLGEEINRTDAYLNGYEVTQGFSSALTANAALAGIMLYSVPNDLYIAKYGAVAGGGPEQKLRAKQLLQAEIMELADAGPVDTKNWFAAKLEGRTYWIRVVKYRSVYIAAAFDLGLLIEDAVKTYKFEGTLAFLDSEENVIIGNVEHLPSLPAQNKNGYNTIDINGQAYLSLRGEVNQLLILYLMPFEGAQGALAPLEAVLIGCLLLLLIAIPFMWIYVRGTVLTPLASLVSTMEKIGQGELTARPSTVYKNKEFEQVNDTFNDMIGQITALKIDSYERQLEAERSEMAALKMQIRPHFVLNCLKNLYALAQTGRLEEIQTLILLLSHHLRYVLANTGDTVPLEKELELCQNYVELISIGQAKASFCSVEMDKRLQKLPIPPVSLLSLVENSVKHGVRENEILRIAINVHRLEMEDGVLANIMIADNGTGFTPQQLDELNRKMPQEKNGEHVGLANTWRRLQLLYGENTAIAFANGKSGGARIELFLPLNREQKEEQHEIVDC